MDKKALTELLPFILKRDNVARYEDGVVYIGDRRKYPFKKSLCGVKMLKMSLALLRIWLPRVVVHT